MPTFNIILIICFYIIFIQLFDLIFSIFIDYRATITAAGGFFLSRNVKDAMVAPVAALFFS
jgi:hypothetical protein